MKKIYLFTFLTLFFFSVHSQTYSTGTVVLNPSIGYSVEFEVNTAGNIVTMTLIGPDSIWLGVGLDINLGLGMGNLGDDCVAFNSSGLQDLNMPAGVGPPNLDATQNWSLDSNITSGGFRTIIATRDRDTGDPNDYVFPATATSFPVLYAFGNGAIAFGYHSANYGVAIANLTLGVNDITEQLNFKISPNPSSTQFDIKLSDGIINAQVEIHDVLGKKIISKNINALNSNVNVANWNRGVYLVKVNADGMGQTTKRFLKK